MAKFERPASTYEHKRLSHQFEKNAWSSPPTRTIYAGISALFDETTTTVALAIRDTTYLLDFLEHSFPKDESKSLCDTVSDFIIHKLTSFSEKHFEKFVGVAMPQEVCSKCPTLCSRLWAELDIVPIVLGEEKAIQADIMGSETAGWHLRGVDEQADSMGRRCLRLFGPDNIPLLQVGFLGLVEVDSDFHMHLTTLLEFRKSVSEKTWAAVQHYADDLKKRKVKIAFFSATPQGGGVALMRHSMVRFSHALDVDMKWYVPKPRPGVFRVTKTTHNILQGVASPEEHLSKKQQEMVHDWIQENAKRYWMRQGGPLRPRAEGGADIIIIDDPQMPLLIPISKQADPTRPVVFRSHIQIRSDLIASPGTPQAEVWEWLWKSIKQADLFISHPVRDFVPNNIPPQMVGYIPASTDWLDGLNKNMRDWDIAYYARSFNSMCRNSGMPTIDYPEDEYIAQIARFDPSKGIFDVLESFDKFHKRLTKESPDAKIPKLLICGHGSIDDPDGSQVYDAAVSHIDNSIPHLRKLIVVMRLPASDQLLNALLSKAKIALQLSSREGFEVKVSEAIHKGKPIIATRAGGIPLQIQNGKNGFLVDVGDTDAVARHVYDLWTDKDLYDRMHKYALENVCDEVSTVGNTLNWLYLASKLSKGEKVEPHERWINDMAREEAGQPYTPEDNSLKRAVEVKYMG